MLGFDTTIFKEPKSQLLKKILLAAVGEILLAFGIVFNSSAGLGNDAVTVLFDGLHKAIGVSFGAATNIINVTLIIILLFFGRKYLNIGTFMYMFLGNIINIAFRLYSNFNIPYTMNGRILTTIIGCILLFLGISCFVAAKVGMDPWNGIAFLLCDKTGKQYGFCKVSTDVTALVLGFALGGTAGVTTVIAAILGGPCIQRISYWLEKFVLKNT